MNAVFEDFERDRLDSIMAAVAPYSLMSDSQRYFLNGLVRCLKPKKVLEDGVALGGGSAIILNALSDVEGARLVSVDYAKTRGDKPIGYAVGECFPELMGRWKLYTGGDVSRFIEEIGGDIDLLALDTAHSHPWETLNFLCVFPFLKKGTAWVLLHDIFLHYLPDTRNALACRYLWSHVASEDKATPAEDQAPFANIGAFRVTEDTEKHIGNLFESLVIPWEAPLPSGDLEAIREIIRKHYPEPYYRHFMKAVEAQEFMFKHPTPFGRAFKRNLRAWLWRNCPRFSFFLKRLRNGLL